MCASTAAPTSARDPLYRGYRFPAEIISHAVWLYFRFALSHRDVEELLAERGVQVSYEAIRRNLSIGLRHQEQRISD